MHAVEAAVRYYGAYGEDIDRWIAENDEAFDVGYAAWRAGQAVKR